MKERFFIVQDEILEPDQVAGAQRISLVGAIRGLKPGQTLKVHINQKVYARIIVCHLNSIWKKAATSYGMWITACLPNSETMLIHRLNNGEKANVIRKKLRKIIQDENS